MQPLEILLGVAVPAVPAVVAGALFLAGARVPLISSVAIAAGYFLGDICVEGVPSFPPAETTQWLAWLAPAAALTAHAARGRVPAWIVRAIFSFAVPWLVMGSIEGRGWSLPRGLAWMAGLGAGTFVLWTSLENLARRRGGASFPLAAWATVVGTSGVLLGSGSLRLALLAGALAAALGAAVVVAWLRPVLSLGGGGAAAAAVILGGLFTSGWLNLDVPLVSALFLAASHAGHWAGEAPALRRLRPWQAATVRLLLSAIPAAVAVVVANWPQEE